MHIIDADMLEDGDGAPSILTIHYKRLDGSIDEWLLFREDEKYLQRCQKRSAWSFDAKGEHFKLAAEALRIDLAHLFDLMMAVHTLNVEPLPHQISAVYESMLLGVPLRYVLADDPGAAKPSWPGC